MGKPYGYLRKSSVRGDLSESFGPETQEREVRSLAQRFGDNGERLVIKADWDISGAGKYTRKRAGYLEMVEAIQNGDCSAVYSYSLSRLGRSVQELSRLFDLCHERSIPVRLVADSIDTSTASGRMTANILASVAQFESEVASERRLAQNATKVARGQSLRTRRRYGEAEGENADEVLRIFRETGSYSKTARLLNEAGSKARSGKEWYATSVRMVVQRLDPTIRSEGRGKQQRTSFLFARLLRCPYCHKPLTGQSTEGRRRYGCSNYNGAPHGRISIAESKVLPWIKAEAARLRIPAETGPGEDWDVQFEGNATAERAELEAARERWIEQYGEGLITKALRDARLRTIDEKAAELDAADRIVHLEPIDWSKTPEAVNKALRGIWDHVELGSDLMPIRAEWFIREWRRPD